MKLKFTKMNGCGNDYIYINCLEKEIEYDLTKLAIKLSDRHFGVGGDGIVLICKSGEADVFMRMFNADGSEGKMCGNAIRCVAKYAYEKVGIKKQEMKIQTLSGIKTLFLTIEEEKVVTVKVNMGVADFNANSMPLDVAKKEVVNEKVMVLGREYFVTCVSMGNPHCVVFLKGVLDLDVNSLGAEFEKLPLFKEEVNIEFVEKKSDDEIIMRVYERGSKETLACGTGACAAVSAMVKNNLCKQNDKIAVNLLGGKLTISFEEDGVKMVGPAEKVFEGEVEI